MKKTQEESYKGRNISCTAIRDKGISCTVSIAVHKPEATEDSSHKVPGIFNTLDDAIKEGFIYGKHLVDNVL